MSSFPLMTNHSQFNLVYFMFLNPILSWLRPLTLSDPPLANTWALFCLREGGSQSHGQAASGQEEPAVDLYRDQLHGEALPPQHRAAVRGVWDQQEDLPGDGVRQRWGPLLPNHHQGEANWLRIQAGVCSDHFCCDTHGESNECHSNLSWTDFGGKPRLLTRFALHFNTI